MPSICAASSDASGLRHQRRQVRVRPDSLYELVGVGSLTDPAARFLESCVAAGLSILVSGGTQAGKTSFKF